MSDFLSPNCANTPNCILLKAYFMNKMHELKNEICHLKNQLEDREKNSDTISMVSFYKSGICLLIGQNSFLKSELQQKQIIVEKTISFAKRSVKN